MKTRSDSINFFVRKNVSENSLIIHQAIIDLLIEKGILTKEEIQARIAEVKDRVKRMDSYRG